MSDPVSHLKRELLAAAERQQGDTVLAPKSRRRWLERARAVSGRRRRLVVVLAAVALATAVTTAGWAIVREVVHDESLVSLPPVGATPSAPESGELVIQYRGPRARWHTRLGVGLRRRAADHSRHASGHTTEPLRPAQGCNPLVERTRRAAPRARGRRAFLRSEVVSTGLFEHHEPAGRLSSPHNVIQVRIGDRLVRAEAKGASDEFPKRLRERLTNPASWLPASAWADRRIRAYVASRYEIWYRAQPQTVERYRILSLLPATAEDLLHAKDAVTAHGDIGNPGFPPHPVTGYHSVLTTEEARAVAQALDDAGLGTSFEIPGTSVDPAPPEKGPVRNVVGIGFTPYLPHGETVCLSCG